MERIDGDSLRARLAAGAAVAGRAVAASARGSRAALHDLHRQHVLHLDLKPANIMLRPDGDAVFLDFGLSRHDRAAGPAGGGFRRADGHRRLHVARAGARATGATRAATSSRWASSSTSSPPAAAVRQAAAQGRHDAPVLAGPAAAARDATPTARRGCRRSSCAASRSILTSATPRPPSSPSRCRTRTRSCSPSAAAREQARRRDGRCSAAGCRAGTCSASSGRVSPSGSTAPRS